MGSQVRGVVCEGTCDGAASWLRVLAQGPKRQAASWICWGGMSAVIGFPDRVAQSVVPVWHKSSEVRRVALKF